VLLEGGPRILAAYDPKLSAKAEEMLRELGVEVLTGSVVTRIEADAVWVGDDRIPTRHVVWAAGVTASPLGSKLGVATDRVGRVIVEEDLQRTRTSRAVRDRRPGRLHQRRGRAPSGDRAGGDAAGSRDGREHRTERSR
jgi:NADPH-dependent 2,4-dienoyl-CoA reductase/sulfur reductase-like enzyme